MKTFTVTEIRDLLNQVYREEISFSRMVEIMNERVNEFKDGDFVVGPGCIFIVHRQLNNYSAEYYVLYAKTNGKLWYDKICWQRGGIDKSKLATEAEKQELLDALAKEGKRWNEKKKCVEDIPRRKFKSGDKVRIKEGISSRTHGNVGPGFMSGMDDFIGKTMTVSRYTHESGYIVCNEYDWNFNEDWLESYVENIPKRKFQRGDKVRIKDGISSKTHRYTSPNFTETMNEFIGKELIVKEYSNSGFVVLFGDHLEYHFNEEWLEPYIEELKKGDLAIFWDELKKLAIIRKYDRLNDDGDYYQHTDNVGAKWNNAIKFESKEQYYKLLKGEL